MKNKKYVIYNSFQNMFVCLTLTLFTILITTLEFSFEKICIGFLQSYVVNQTIVFMLDMDVIDEWFNNLFKIKDYSLSNAIINTLIYGTIINFTNTIFASRINVLTRFFNVYPWRIMMGIFAAYNFSKLSKFITKKLTEPKEVLQEESI